MKSKKLLAIVGASIIVGFSNTAMAEDHWDNRLGVFFGSKHLDKAYYEDNKHGAFGIKFDLKKHSWPVSIAIDLMSAGEEKDTVNGKVERVTGGFHLGVRKHWQINESFEPFFAGGLNYNAAEKEMYVDDLLQTDNDKDVGYWVSSGVALTFENGLNLGAEIRYSDSEVSLFDEKIKTGGVYSGLFLEYRF